GIFILLNESGIRVGPSGQIDAANIILATRNLDTSDFLDGDYLFRRLSKDQLDILLLNEGTIQVQDGGFGVLIAGAIDNKGKIIAPTGKIALAAGDAIRLDISGNGLISVAIDEPTASTVFDYEGNPVTKQITSTGTLDAQGGTVILKAESINDVFTKAINLEGVVRGGKVAESGGVIRIVADGDVEIGADI
ncbi:MAG: hypothetical protein GY839_06430, partial [candidate division Zixibacteria bacterium]|nr:hypothetical protein [candidate division Zixibacteria bacterium]